MADDVLHSFTKTVIVRVKTNLYKGGKMRAFMSIDTDATDADALLAMLTRAQFAVLHGNGDLHDDLDMLPALIEETVGPVLEVDDDD